VGIQPPCHAHHVHPYPYLHGELSPVSGQLFIVGDSVVARWPRRDHNEPGSPLVKERLQRPHPPQSGAATTSQSKMKTARIVSAATTRRRSNPRSWCRRMTPSRQTSHKDNGLLLLAVPGGMCRCRREGRRNLPNMVRIASREWGASQFTPNVNRPERVCPGSRSSFTD
jgi:hypothetical protein